MGYKIKWNDDRVRGATTALLLITRDRLSRGETDNLIEAALADYRDDPDSYKTNKSVWADVKDTGPLTLPRDVAYYRNLISKVDEVLAKLLRDKRQFNSLTELDNFLVFALKDVR